MKANLKTFGIITISAALLYYPAKKLYEYIAKKRAGDNDNNENEADAHAMKAFSPAYRGTHKAHPHHRQ